MRVAPMTDLSRVAFDGIDEERLGKLARHLSAFAQDGGLIHEAAIHLHGPLGAGKTTFARAFLRALGVGERIKSPTYSLIETYDLQNLSVHHLDLYRIADADELEWLGLRDLATGQHLWLIEWPERGAGAIPAADLNVRLEHAGGVRDLRLEAATEHGSNWLRRADFVHSAERTQPLSPDS
jgi:tRNA threonylcarbamoyladenosine biosynthesis protein TsaE